ncbi:MULTISPECIES: hypothetical protein [unclassified Enterococcus]|uniref:DUF7278 family profilin-like fold-containing protein n=1 Tax=unclassified Enterococcus TaxID=2608891 RepID=UPI001555A8BA|nr:MULTISPECIES: hypothetical protein [unclassified Enterococcus]MBS7577640.1 hypothetical protein [Enterococcus sp. MMGLQ5-2]MBS7584166.1 hypothetical protein [Enterococcus sp. MMGLQ5-1]NPD12024.1 hypothetical protein [Enterococcus sp. MMGLQ5-1]NPD37473.1 hypothetical protein [Enterococcus sp. MMGLQ5-2]
MKVIPELESTYWKQTNDQEKYELFELKIKPKISENLKLTKLQLKTFEMSGIKLRSFQFLLNQEPFTFIPGAKNVILGWDNGGNDDILREVLLNSYDELVNSAERQKEFSGQNFNDWINAHTTHLRKVDIPPMIVAKYALPASTEFIGMINPITGTFLGDEISFREFQEAVQEILFPKLSFTESINFVQPDIYLDKQHFFLDLFPFTEKYRLFRHMPQTYRENIQLIDAQGFRLLTENEWEYVVGGGTRKLFRFNTQAEVAALLETGDSFHKVKVTESENMFGLVIDSSRTRYELTNDAFVLKLTNQAKTGNIVRDILPLATYFQSHHGVSISDKLSPEHFQYRKVIDLLDH